MAGRMRAGDEPESLAEHLEAVRAKAAAVPVVPEPVESPEARAQREARRTAALEASRLERFLAATPARFRSASLADLPPDGPGGEARAWAQDPGGRNCVHVGPVGVGKTHAAVAQAREVACRFGLDVWTVTTAELLDRLRPGGDEGAGERAASVGLLVLDDLGAERPTDWTAERLAVVIDRRWVDQLPIVATSNLTPGPSGSLIEALGERSYSRLVGSGAVVIRWQGDDRRRARP